MLRVVEAQYNSIQSELKKISQIEQRVRIEILRIDSQLGDLLYLPGTTSIEYKFIGAEVLWRSRLSKQKRALTLELAKVLAKKTDLILKLNHAHVKFDAVKLLAERLAETRRVQKRKRLEDVVSNQLAHHFALR